MSGDAQENQREYPRISIPLLVELKHPLLGTHRTTAENVSAGGLFVALPADAQAERVSVQSRLKVRLLNATQIGPQATPTVEMVVMRSSEKGLGLKFANETSRFLWESAERKRVELAVGRDYFQVHLSAIVQRKQRLLLVEERGHWVFPGCYLQVGESWQEAMNEVLATGLGLEDCMALGPIDIQNNNNPTLPAVATLRVFYGFNANTSAVVVPESSEYRDFRWFDKMRSLKDITFANPADRQIVEQQLVSMSTPAVNSADEAS